jgi:hypothetical protein
VNVAVDDDDIQTIVPSTTSVSLTEGGSNGTFTVRLSNDPLGTASVSVASGDAGAATVSPATLTFNSSNYDQPQTVTVSPVSDADVADESVAVTLSSAGISNATVNVAVDDDDIQTLIVSTTTVAVNEGSNGTFTVRLSNDPLASFTVNLSSSDTTAVSVSPATLTFNSGNYDQPQTVTVAGVNDADRVGETVPVTVSGSGVTSVTVTVTTTDTTPSFAVDMFVRIFAPAAQVANHQLTYLGGDRYSATVSLVGPAVFNFKIGDVNNTLATTFAASATTSTVITLGSPLTLVRTNNNNIQLLVIQNSAGTFNYRFDLNATNTTNPVLTVTLL